MKLATDTLLIQVQVIVTAAMTGIIWMVQCVTYPQFLDMGVADFEKEAWGQSKDP